MHGASQNEIENEEESHKNFITSLDSKATRRSYSHCLSYYMKFLGCARYNDLVIPDPKKIEGNIHDYIIYLKNRKLAPASVSLYVTAVTHFYEMNDVIVNWKKIKKYKGKHRAIVEDRPYQKQEIKKLIELAPLRDKAIICLLASSGMRRGALPRLRLKDIDRIDKYNLLKFTVYKNESESYIAYCTPECMKLIDEYMQYRGSLGEKLGPNTPLFRQIFDSVLQINRPLVISEEGISRMISRLLKDLRIRPLVSGRGELMETHGLRKFFKTTCINAGMNPLYSEYLMGHRSGLTKSYFKPTDAELLEGNDKALGYVAAINDLTINEECRLHKKIAELTKKKDEIELMEIKHREELKTMREEMESKFRQLLTRIDVGKIVN